MPLIDSYNRQLTYLRISLTDRCNFRCVYCMPPEGISLLPREEVLRMEEFEQLGRIFVSLGVNKIRLTGGEPLLRKKIVSLVASLSSLPGLSEIGLTTNGSFLAPLALPLKEAGLTSVNVSLDSLSRLRFHKVTLKDEFDEVIYGITRAVEVGLKVKVNVVALSDLTQKEVGDFCQLAYRYPLEVRFLEFMPLCGTGYRPELVLSMKQLKEWVFDFCSLDPLERNHQVADTYQVRGGPGCIGFISSMSEPFCGDCNRLRLSSTGQLHLCLFSDKTVDLRTPLRGRASEEEISKIIQNAVWRKPKGHEEIRARREDHELPKIMAIGG